MFDVGARGKKCEAIEGIIADARWSRRATA
jgi:hypothetical protein